MEPNQPLDGSYGYDLERLLRVPAPPGPPDFAAFWQETHTAARRVPLRLERRRIASASPAFELYEVEFDGLGGARVGSWVTLPADGRFTYGVVQGHGYGEPGAPASLSPGPPAVTIYPCARGFARSARPGLPNNSGEHVLHGIAARETYLHRFCVADLWSAASALLEMFPETAPSLYYAGASFGGGIGALALPWEKRFRKAYLDVPSFGNHPLRVQLPCAGSGEAVRHYHKRHPEALDVLAYFDAATAARHTHIPVLVSPALRDPAVPPPGQFAVYNGLAGPKKLFVRRTGHPDTADDGAQLSALVPDWFTET